ncbi:peroxiredoxin [Spiroplasma chrysopicola]|uniref:thioredoxin-dependent peroxiredoxin n=1 Tax=Spiroplasma chrysopicola DF-1 TaxID=1276227 RepID=R4U372_9MOLU|nr:peroxiredoxin [Spiroplasma chrysopicola]AGM24943.1 bacterioferritin comigratory protein [Spiroplasma chrysopicola DF-1]
MDLKTTKLLFSDNIEHLLSEFQQAKGYIIYFFPKANTSACTLETVEYNRLYDQFMQAGYSVIGVSRDVPKKQQQFKLSNNIKFPLVCDVDSQLCNTFNVLKQKKMFNNTFMGIERSTFMLDNDFNILHEWRNVKAVEHISDVLKLI